MDVDNRNLGDHYLRHVWRCRAMAIGRFCSVLYRHYNRELF